MKRSSAGVALVLVLVARTAVAQTEDPSLPAPPQDAQPIDTQTEPVEGTSWASLVKDTGRDFVSFPQRRSTWVLLAAGGALALAAHPADDWVQTHLAGNATAEKIFGAGKIIGSGYFHAGAIAGLLVAGRYIAPTKEDGRTNPLAHLGFDLIRAQIVTQTLVQSVKYSVQRDRPTGECCAFPSAHAASAFAAAAVLERHFGYRASWPALVAASYVGISRIVDNRHFLSDVIFGAALGEAVGWTIVGRHGKRMYVLRPVPIRGGMMIALMRTE
jgi:membrane-associated phospholipid phosphatase